MSKSRRNKIFDRFELWKDQAIEQTDNPRDDEPSEITIDSSAVDSIAKRLSHYQEGIKLACTLVAITASYIIIGARVEFLSTFPLFIFVPFICGLFYKRSGIIILYSFILSVITGQLIINAEPATGTTIWPFVVMATASTAIGVLSAAGIRWAFKRNNSALKICAAVIAVALLCAGSIYDMRMQGSPIGYITSYMKVKNLIDTKYPQDDPSSPLFVFKGIQYSVAGSYGSPQVHDIHQYSVKYDWYGKGDEKQVWFVVDADEDWQVWDTYKEDIDSTFAGDRSKNLRAYLQEFSDLAPMSVTAFAASPLDITWWDLDDTYYMQMMDPYAEASAAEKAEAEKTRQEFINRRKQETAKLDFHVYLGVDSPYLEPNAYANYAPGPMAALSKDEFIRQALVVQKVLNEQKLDYSSVEIISNVEDFPDKDEQYQKVTIKRGLTPDEVKASYRTSEYDLEP